MRIGTAIVRAIVTAIGITALVGVVPIVSATASPAASAAPSMASVQAITAPPSWSGTWRTVAGSSHVHIKMILSEKGSSVKGTYKFCKGTITGTVRNNGSVLRGKWSQAKPRPCGGTGEPTYGSFVFRMSANGKKFSGYYTWGTTKTPKNPWSGTRVSGSGAAG